MKVKTVYICFVIQSQLKQRNMTTIDFQDIKNEIITRGLANVTDANAATQKVIAVTGEWRRDNTIAIINIGAGFVIGDFNKTVAVRNDLPQNLTSKQEIVDLLQSQYPDAKIIAKVL